MTGTNRLRELLNVKYPIIQGGMAWVADGKLAASVSNGGGLGVIGTGTAPPSQLEAEIKTAKEQTELPFGVNVMMLSPYVDEIMDLIIKEQVPVVTTGAGNPGKYLERLRDQGIKVIPVIPSVSLAKRMEKQGVDAVIAEGNEAGGHIGEMTTMTLIPQVASQVDIPVIAAGGIADGRGVTAALALGAQGVQIGTRFICATECTAHNNYKQAVIKAKDRGTVVTARSTGHPVRVIKNKFSKELQRLELELTPEKLEEVGAGKLSLAVKEGDVDLGSVMAGQIAGLVNKEQPAKEIIEEIITETSEVITELGNHNTLKS